MARLTMDEPRGGVRELAIAVALPVVIGVVAALLTWGSMGQYAQFNQPPLSPPGWLFPAVWTILYILMGLSSYLIWQGQWRRKDMRDAQWVSLLLYVLQLFFNFCWPLLFFKAGWYYVAFAWLVVMWLTIIALIISVRRVNMVAAGLLVPYLLWVTFAGYLNLAVAILN